MIDSFDPNLISTVAEHGSTEVGYDLPLKPVKEPWLRYAAQRDFEWVYLEQRYASPTVVKLAHGFGLKVCLYGIDDPAALERFRPSWPDAVITDTAGWWHDISW